ncbi:MAG: sigma-54-dependent Fis family transcriptional regulator [Candidatus Eisenbacteria sp.]|nr:sigma-54-dependent Fis family transcriptional regulator [Candidatus Eisenbacteria bacterium]
MARILIIDDEEKMCRLVAGELDELGHEVRWTVRSREAMGILENSEYDVVITDLRMDPPDGLEILRFVKDRAPTTEVVLMTAYASAQTAVEAMKSGAYDYLVKPFDIDELTLMVGKIVEKQDLKLENVQLKEAMAGGPATLVGESEGFQRVRDLIDKVAIEETPVFITGESGVGKELVARQIHAQSPRAGQPFIAVNCSAFPETLLESEIFGYERGAFTGAGKKRLGWFEIAGAGTLFLDEVADISPSVQVKLLRVLQDRTFTRLGSNQPISLQARILSATNRDVREAIDENRLREDFFYRLSVFPIHVPPLRERPDDIPPLVKHFLKKRGKGASVEPDAMHQLQRHSWPGNVRELENAVERAAILSGGKPITVRDLSFGAIAGDAHGAESMRQIPPEGLNIEDLEADLIRSALHQTGGNKAEAARLLGMTRRRLYSRMSKHGIQ